jgi:hypothetical protein
MKKGRRSHNASFQFFSDFLSSAARGAAISATRARIQKKPFIPLPPRLAKRQGYMVRDRKKAEKVLEIP